LKAIIGATATGKSDFAIELAKKTNSLILSLDSLSIYKEIDIASAKPSKKDLESVKHFGINEVFPNEKFSVKLFINLFHKAKIESQKHGKELLIVGGTSFYLKTLLSGLSPVPKIANETIQKRNEILENLSNGYELLAKLDPVWAKKVKSTDRYRIEKALDIYLQTEEIPTQFFKKNRPQPIIEEEIEIINLIMDRDILRKRILKRTEKMVQVGLIDEVKTIAKKYGENIEPIKAIGLKESLQFLKGEIQTKEELIDLIATHTAQLAKRQRTFNRTQFKNVKNIELFNSVKDTF
jgi:tRNA dimethylallyltransferase